MSRAQMIFGSMFSNQYFGPRNGFEFRAWQGAAGECYSDSVRRFRASFGSNVQHRFTLVAGTGSGKTKAVGGLAAWLLNARLVDQLVFVCPNRSIRRKTQKDFKTFFNIDLRVFHKRKHEDGIPREVQGYILTYAHMMQDPTLHRRICQRVPTLVIFDEIHHLGDDGTWGASAEEAFGKVPFVIGVSGTPYRSDNRRIPFVTYEEKADQEGVICFRADPPFGYAYNLGRAVDDGVCRKPIFLFSGGTVRLRFGTDTGTREVSFDDTGISAEESALRLKGAVRYGATTRRKMLGEALERCRAEGRKAIIFLGGDTEGEQTPTQDAREFLPLELCELGLTPAEFEVVTGDDPESHAKIEEFGASDKWVLVSINMVSEGVDIPELSAAVFLTSITAKQTTVQRIGRVLRHRGDDETHHDGLIFMFADPVYRHITEEIETIIEHEVTLKRPRGSESNGANGGGEAKFRAEAIGIDGGEIVMAKVKDLEVPIAKLEAAKDELRRRGLPSTVLHAFLLVTTKG